MFVVTRLFSGFFASLSPPIRLSSSLKAGTFAGGEIYSISTCAISSWATFNKVADASVVAPAMSFFSLPLGF